MDIIFVIFLSLISQLNGSLIIKHIKSKRGSIILTSDFVPTNNNSKVVHLSGKYKESSNSIEHLWKKNELSYTILGNVAYFNQTSMNAVKKTVRSAFNDWQTYAPFTFIDRTSSKEADIKIIFTRDGFDARGYKHTCERLLDNSEAHAYFANHAKFPGEIHVNNEKFWLESTNPRGVISLKSILLHEIGHVLGLHHSHDPQSIMYPYFYTNTVKTISFSDSIELHLLYRRLCD